MNITVMDEYLSALKSYKAKQEQINRWCAQHVQALLEEHYPVNSIFKATVITDGVKPSNVIGARVLISVHINFENTVMEDRSAILKLMGSSLADYMGMEYAYGNFIDTHVKYAVLRFYR